jgi:hypothetical protein
VLLKRVQKFEKLINDVFFVDFFDEIFGGLTWSDVNWHWASKLDWVEKRKFANLKFKNYLKNFISKKKFDIKSVTKYMKIPKNS